MSASELQRHASNRANGPGVHRSETHLPAEM